MHKLINTLYGLLLFSTPVLTLSNATNYKHNLTANIIQKNVSNQENKNYNSNNTSNSNDISNGIYLYNPYVKVNDISDNFSQNKQSSNDDSKYYDFVFLKSLNWDSNKMTINSSEDNLKSKDSLSKDYIEENQDIEDYKNMLKFSDKTGHSAIKEGLSLVNRYLNNGLLKFNLSGYIPSRTTFFNSLKNYKNNTTEDQSVITNNYGNNSLNDISDYVSINLHWSGIDLSLKPKLISWVFLKMMNNFFSSMGETIVGKEFKSWIWPKIEAFIARICFATSEEVVMEMDETLMGAAPEADLIITPIGTAFSYLFSKAAEYALDKAVYKVLTGPVQPSLNTLAKIIQSVCQKGVTHQIDPKSISFQVDINYRFWDFWNSQASIQPIYPITVYSPMILPASPGLYFNKTANLITGNSNDFSFIMNYQYWNSFLQSIDNNDVNSFLRTISLFNPDIILTSDQWRDIVSQLTSLNLADGYAISFHVINGKINFQNINPDGTTDMHFSPESPFIKASFIGTDNSNNLMISVSQLRFLLNTYDYIKTRNIKGKYDNYKDNFYYNYIATSDEKTSFWKSPLINKDTIETFIENCYYTFTDPDKKSDKIDFSSLVSTTTSKSPEILNLSSEEFVNTNTRHKI